MALSFLSWLGLPKRGLGLARQERVTSSEGGKFLCPLLQLLNQRLFLELCGLTNYFLYEASSDLHGPFNPFKMLEESFVVCVGWEGSGREGRGRGCDGGNGDRGEEWNGGMGEGENEGMGEGGIGDMGEWERKNGGMGREI